MGFIPQNGITHIVIMRYLHIVEQDDVFQFR